MNEQPFKYFPALTGIRAICVYFIFLKHLNFFSPESNAWLFVNQFYSFLDFFFVLSGFVIYHKYHEIATLKSSVLYKYFVNRFSRVFPILFILVTATFLLGLRDNLYTTNQAGKLYFLNITLLKGFSSNYYLSGIGPSWSLSVEELFYFLSPLIFLFVKKTSSIIKMILLVYLAGLLITFLFIKFPFDGYFSSYHFTAIQTFFGRVFEFACGIYLAILVGKSNTIQSTKKGRLALYTGPLLILLCLIGQFAIAQTENLAHGYENWLGVIINNLVLPVGITLLFYSLVYYKSFLQSFLSSKTMVELGNATYSFYLLHTSFVLSWIQKISGAQIWATFLLMIITSVIFYRLVEQPLALFLRSKLTRKRKPATNTGVASS